MVLFTDTVAILSIAALKLFRCKILDNILWKIWIWLFFINSRLVARVFNLSLSCLCERFPAVKLSGMVQGSGPGLFVYHKVHFTRLDIASNKLTNLQNSFKFQLLWWCIYFMFLNPICQYLYHYFYKHAVSTLPFTGKDLIWK